jgi:hypothetical protein
MKMGTHACFLSPVALLPSMIAKNVDLVKRLLLTGNNVTSLEFYLLGM